jgi:hypothetical protein
MSTLQKTLLRLSVSATMALLLTACCDGVDASNSEVVPEETNAQNNNIVNPKNTLLSVVGELNITKTTDNQTEITAEDMVLSADGTKIFIANGSAGLKVVDVSNPKQPKLIGEYDDIEDDTEENKGGFARRITISSDKKTLYMADGLAGLKVIDISTPTNPSLIDKFDTVGFSHGIAISPDDSRVYISDNGEDGGTPGIRIVNVEDNDLWLIHQREEQWATQVAISKDGKTAYITDKKVGILIVDVHNAEDDITTLGTYKVIDGGISADIVLSKDGKTAYVANKKQGIKVIDISDSTNPKLISTFDTDNIAKSITLSKDDKTLFIADRQTGIEMIDVSDKNIPKLLEKIKTNSAEDVLVSKNENYLYVADGKAGIKVIKIRRRD